MWLTIPAMLAITVGFDLLTHWKRPDRVNAGGQTEPKIYYPNLRLWGLGLIAGMATFAAQLFQEATARLNSEPLMPGVLWPRLAPSVYLIALLWLLVWGVVRLCRPE